MKRAIIAALATIWMSSGAFAADIGVAMANSENFLVIVRNAMEAEAAKHSDAHVQYLDAENDALKQIDQVQNLISQHVDAIIVNPVDSSFSPQMTKLATEAKIPLVYVNRAPAEKELPKNVVFVGSDEHFSGAMQIKEIARMLGNKGNVAILQGDIGTVPGVLRTEKVEEYIKTQPEMKVVFKDAANFLRTPAKDVVTTWLTLGERIDAIAANNDEMAIGAIIALEEAGIDPKTVLIGGIDATPDALDMMKQGKLAVTVFQDAAGQGRGSMDAAIKMAAGQNVDSFVWIPFQLVTRDNMSKYTQ